MAKGTLRKMFTELDAPVRYSLRVGEEQLPLNERVGSELWLDYTGNIFCTACGRKTKTSFDEGYCFPCSQKLAECDMCIVRPERCHFAEGTCRQPEWGIQSCMQPHVVYLANSSGIKVGITRHHQIPTRWIDQGATQALPIFRVPSRHISGLVEVLLAKHVADKTDWRKMLKPEVEVLDMVARRDELLAIAHKALTLLMEEQGEGSIEPIFDAEVVNLAYPTPSFPEKLNSFNFDKAPRVGGVLLGIKGQYLMFEGGVINVRKFTGYEVEVT